MQIQFTITVHNFLDAAAIEELLKEKKIKYCVDSDCTPVKPSKRKKHVMITEKMVRDIANHFKNHPNDTITRVAKQFGISKSSVSRIYQGTHSLQQR